MTNNDMPSVIWAERNPVHKGLGKWFSAYNKTCTRYIRQDITPEEAAHLKEKLEDRLFEDGEWSFEENTYLCETIRKLLSAAAEG